MLADHTVIFTQPDVIFDLNLGFQVATSPDASIHLLEDFLNFVQDPTHGGTAVDVVLRDDISFVRSFSNGN